MKQVKIECQISSYDELPKASQDKLLKKEYELFQELLRFDHLIDDFKERLEAIGFLKPNIWFSGFGSQGDGLCFDAKVDLEKVCKHLGIEYNAADEIICHIVVVTYHYTHERSRAISTDGPAEFQDKLEELRLNLCKQFYKELEEDAEAQTGQEVLLESLRSREYVFGGELIKELIDVAGNLDAIQII